MARVQFRTAEVAALLRPLMRGRLIEEVFCRNRSAIRAANSILSGTTGYTELSRADLVFSAAGRPDLMTHLEEVNRRHQRRPRVR